MTRSPSRFWLADGLATLGIGFGAWLIHLSLQPASDLPHAVLLLIGGVDILFCCGMLGYLLRLRLQEGERLPKSWIVVSAVLSAGFLGWITALFLDAERLRADLHLRRQADQHLAQIDDAVRQFQQVLPSPGHAVDPKRWNLVHDRYARELDQLQSLLHGHTVWEKEVAQIHDQVASLQKMVSNPSLARDQAQQLIEKLRADVSHGETEARATHRARWHGIGATALMGVFLLCGSGLLWLVFDRELRRRTKANHRLAASEAHFRSLVEHQPDAFAALDAAGNIAYTSAAWQSAFGYEADEVEGRNLLELIHADDRPQVQLALQQKDPQHTVPCRLSADYGIWHDVEMHCQKHDDEQTTVVRFRNLRESADTPITPDAQEEPSILKLPAALHVHDVPALTYLYDPAGRHFVSVNNLPAQALGYVGATMSPPELLASIVHPDDEARVFRSFALTAGAHDDAVSEEEIRLRDAENEYQWYAVYHRALPAGRDPMRKVAGVAFPIHKQKRTEALHAASECRVQTLAESERQARAELEQQRAKQKEWEAAHQEQREKHGHLHQALREHEQQRKHLETSLGEREENCKKLEAELRERDLHRHEMEATLRDHQDRLHELHQTHEGHAHALKSSKEAMRRLASGVANDFNKILSVVLGYTDVLRESFPKDHLAQNYVDEMRQAANHGAELTQKLLAFSRNHLLQMIPVELNQQLAGLEAKVQDVLGHEVKVEWERAHEELWVKTDPHPIEQALLHLLDHARCRMTHGGTLTIRTRRLTLTKTELIHADMTPGSYVELRLQDHGSAIDDETRQHLFEPYYPAKEGQKSDLGLATANGIIRQSGGCIDVENVPNQGSEVVLLLPWTDERPATAAVA